MKCTDFCVRGVDHCSDEMCLLENFYGYFVTLDRCVRAHCSVDILKIKELTAAS